MADGKRAEHTVQEDSARVRVTRWRFAPGEETGWHVHEWDYVVVPTIGGELTMVAPDGAEATAALTAGVSYARPAGVHHNVVNRSDATVEFVEIELK